MKLGCMSHENTKLGCILICAGKGDLRAARSIVTKALKSVAPKAPRSYIGQSESKSYGLRDPRYTVECTEKTFTEIQEKIGELAKVAGFNQSPVDCYQD